MATWVIVGTVVVLVLIVVAVVAVTMIATRARTKPIRIPGFSRAMAPEPEDRPDTEDP